nr:MAG TPA: hypothetical protein [Caudoviricetes sp.]
MNGRPLYNYNVRADLGVGQPLCLKPFRIRMHFNRQTEHYFSD